METNQPFDLHKHMFIGRTYTEYVNMFQLTDNDLKEKRILDCPAGASSFIAQLTKQGGTGIATDILYQLSPAQLEEKSRQDLDKAIKGLFFTAYLNEWEHIDIDQVKKNRLEACQTFISDFKIKQNLSYIPSSLPNLPFREGEFNLVLSSNLLFLYDDVLDYTFHLQTIQEMLRVSDDEVRIFPLMSLNNQESPFLQRIIKDFDRSNFKTEVTQTTFDFNLGGTEILTIKKT